MAQQEEGWPLGLQPVNVRMGLARNRSSEHFGSVSFNTSITGSPTSFTDSSSALDTESTESFFHYKSITLGSLIGVSRILELSRRSVRQRKTEEAVNDKKKNKNTKTRTCCFSLCSRDSNDSENVQDAASLGHFLAVERRAANNNRRNPSSPIYAPDDLALAQPVTESNTLFVNGCIAPPQLDLASDTERRRNGGSDNGNRYIVPLLLSCICGQTTH